MSPRQTRPAKLTPPGLSQVYPRTRLFHRLDALRDHPLIWIAAPAGAGKTTLAASYLQAREITPLWYRVDPGDADPATFFYYLGEGLRYRTRARRRTVPLLAPEYQADLPAFSRRFFRELFARMRATTVLVLDNLEAVDDSAFHEMLRHGLEEVPPGHQVIITSRREPPPSLARAAVRLAMLDWHDLRLTADESRAILRLLAGDRALPARLVDNLEAAAGGWVTGLLLQLERTGDTRADREKMDGVTGDNLPQRQFDDYFSNEVFDHLPEPTQRLLLHTAWLSPVRPGTACRLAGLRDAGQRLEWLAQRQMFVTRLAGARPGYVYHPLLREFLRARAEAELPDARLHALKCRSAHVLAGSGETDAAAELLWATGQWDSLEDLIQEQAPALLGQGRHRRLHQWLERLPRHRLESEPRLRLLAGSALLAFDPVEAGRHFRAAWTGFETTGDPAGLHSAWLGIMDSIMFANDSLEEIPRWLQALDRVQGRFGPAPDPAVAARVALTAFNTGFTACPESRPLAHWEETAETLRRGLPAIADDTARCLAAACLAMFFTWHPQPARLKLLADDLLPLAGHERVAPLARVIACLVEITRRWATGETTDTVAFIDAALDLVERHGIAVGRLWLLSAATIYYLTRQDTRRARDLLERYRRHIRPGNRHEQIHHHYLSGWLAWLQGETALALEHAARACTDIRALHTPHFELLARCAHAFMLIETDRHDQARTLIADTRRLAAACHSRSVEVFYLGLLEAWSAWRRDDHDAIPGHLRPALACGRERDLQVVLWHLPPVLSRLCAVALEHDIETEYVRRLIHRNGLPRPPGADPLTRWPDAIRIHALGRFRIERLDQALDTTNRAWNKPLRLLKVIVALGARDVPAARVEDILWPEADGGNARRTLITTLQRLRKLLGDGRALRFDDGRLSLDSGIAWLDIDALTGGLGAEDPARLDRALRLYRGPLFDEEGDPAWLLPARARLHDEVLHGYDRLARHLRETGRWQDLADLCRRGLTIDDLHEPFYRDGMLAHREQGRQAEAARLYHRCRKRLQEALGTRPSTATETLFATLSQRAGP